jgi:hypothetical protein
MRPVVFGEALSAGARLTLFSDDKPDRFFTVIKFWMDETSGVALELKTGVPIYQVEDGLPRRRLAGGGRKAGPICSFACRSRNGMNTDGVFGGRITQALIRGRSSRVRWLRNRPAPKKRIALKSHQSAFEIVPA